MARILKIKSCDECPHHVENWPGDNIPYCHKSERDLPYYSIKSAGGGIIIGNVVRKIPRWCKLKKA